MDRFCWFDGEKITESYGFTVKCPNGHVWNTDGGDSPDEPLVLVYRWAETGTGKPDDMPDDREAFYNERAETMP